MIRGICKIAWRCALHVGAIALLGAPTAAVAQTLLIPDRRLLTPMRIDRLVSDLMRANAVQGLAVALVRDGRVAFVRGYGVRDGEGRPLTVDTVLYGASLTKATFAWFVMQLVDEGRIDLDRPIGDLLPHSLPDYAKYADLADDPRWRRLTMRMLLDHTSGFANFRFIEPDGKLRFHRDPGTRYGYSGEGINLAQFVLEEGLGLDVGREMQRRVFDRFAMTRTSMTWRAEFASNVANLFVADGAEHPHERRRSVRAAGSMDTTIADWARFLAATVRGEGLTAESRRAMTSRQIAIDSPRQFPTLDDATTDAYRSIALGYGLGWGVFETPFGPSFFKEGHDDGTGNYALCIERHRACVLLMSNSDRAEGIFKALVDGLMGDTRLPWRWENYIPFDLR